MKYVRILLASLIMFMSNLAYAECQGEFANPITDICWSCMYPISVGSFEVMKGKEADTPNPANPICACSSPIPRIGISVGFWEPVRYVDVTHKPFCFVGLGGIELDMPDDFRGGGAQSTAPSGSKSSFYYTHWYDYPALFWLDLIVSALCVERGSFDVVYMSEFDWTWTDDTAAMLVNPEVVLFANPIAQAACTADCLATASAKLPNDPLYWCAGCDGSMYPLSGNIASHVTALQASTLMVERTAFKLHRLGYLTGTTGKGAMCSNSDAKNLMPIMRKSQYRNQMAYPIPANGAKTKFACNPFGRSTVFWESGKSFPIKGEDFGYFVWRKRNCCAL